jgi:uncharacterized protein YceK
MRRIAAALTLTGIVGCGTVENFVTGPDGRTTPYGGVRIAADKCNPASGRYYDVAFALGWPFYVTDVPLSAIGDTLTLPLTLAAALGHAINDSIKDYYFPPDRPTGDQLRQSWSGDVPPRPDLGPGTPTPPAQ